MLYNSIFVDRKVYTLQLKKKSTVGVVHRILQNFRTATFESNFWGLLLRRKQRRRRSRTEPCGFGFSLFSEQLFIHEIFFFLHKFLPTGAFQFGLCYLCYKPKKWLSSPVFTIRILLAEIFG